MRGLARQRPAGHDRGRVEAAAQEGGDRHVAHEVGAHRLVEPLENLRFQIVGTAFARRWKIPVLSRRKPARPVPGGRVSGLELADVAERGPRRGDVPELQVHVQRLPVQDPLGWQGLVEGLQLGRKRDAPGPFRDVERLDAKPVAREEQRLGRRVPDGEREHAAEQLDTARTVLLIEVQNRLGIALRRECVSAPQQLAPQVAVIVDLAVEDDDLGPIFVENRLAPAGQVDDAEPPHAQSHGAVHIDTLVVRPSVPDRFAHLPHEERRDRAVPVRVDESYDAAHTSARWSKSRAMRDSETVSPGAAAHRIAGAWVLHRCDNLGTSRTHAAAQSSGTKVVGASRL